MLHHLSRRMLRQECSPRPTTCSPPTRPPPSRPPLVSPLLRSARPTIDGVGRSAVWERLMRLGVSETHRRDEVARLGRSQLRRICNVCNRHVVAHVHLSYPVARARRNRATVITSVTIFLASVLAAVLIDPSNWGRPPRVPPRRRGVDKRNAALRANASSSGPDCESPLLIHSFAAVVFAPLAILPFRVALSLVIMFGLTSRAGSCVIMARRAGWDRRHAVLVGLTVAAVSA